MTTKKKRRLFWLGLVVVMLVALGIWQGFLFWQESTRGLRAQSVDLNPFCNAHFLANWVRPEWAPDNLASLPRGIRVFAGVRFRVGEGLIQLNGRELMKFKSTFPPAISGIPLSQKCRRLHLLHAGMYSADESAFVGMLVLHYADGKEDTFMLNYGYHLRDWWARGSSTHHLAKSLTTKVAWSGTNAVSRAGEYQRLFRTSFENPRPTVAIETLDYRSTMSRCAPFLVALSYD